jgi:signal peptidase
LQTRREHRAQTQKAPKRTSLFVRIVSWFLGAVIVVAASSFVAIMIVLGTATPFTATVGHSMNPLLYEGDLAVVQAIEPNRVKTGDVVRINITSANQKQFGLPNTILHRVVSVRNSDIGLMFTTKGDNNPLNDTFETRADNVTGIMINHYPRLGYALLMAQSPTAPFLGYVALALIAAYILIAWLESAMNSSKLREQTLRELVGEIPALKDKIDLLTSQLDGPTPKYVSYFEEDANRAD